MQAKELVLQVSKIKPKHVESAGSSEPNHKDSNSKRTQSVSKIETRPIENNNTWYLQQERLRTASQNAIEEEVPDQFRATKLDFKNL